MGLFNLFGDRGSKVDKLVKKVTNAYTQPQDRQGVMQQLAEMRSDEALYGLCQRFTYRTEQSIVDEDEKRLAYQLLVDAGPAAIAPIKRFVEEHDAVYWPLRALKDIAGMDTAVEFLLKALDRAGERDIRQNEQRLQLVSNLRDFPHPEVKERLMELVRDEDEEVRTLAIDGLITYGEDVAKEPAVERILDPEESPRVKTVVLEQIIENDWSLEPWREQLEGGEEGESALPVPYVLTKDGKLTRDI
ncbi:MAG: HEAT repeat domain-containing protein [Myxococcota bacterium]